MEDIIEFTICNYTKKLNVLTHKLDDPKIILIHLHGMHSTFQFTSDEPDEFYNRIKILKNYNIISYALEFSGHGKSDGKKALINNFNDLVEDLDCLINYVNKYYNNEIPIYLLGESMGGTVSVKYSYLNPKKIKGIVLLAPLLGIAELPNNIIINSILALSYVFPTLDLKSFYRREDKHNLKYIKLLEKNKYNFSSVLTLSSVRECYDATNWIENNINEFNLPILVFHSENDKTTDFSKTEIFFNKCINKINELISFKEIKHNLLIKKDENDLVPHIILNKIANWIN